MVPIPYPSLGLFCHTAPERVLDVAGNKSDAENVYFT